MSDETQQRAVEYLLGEMEAPDAARFEAEIEGDPGLRRAVDELRPVVTRLESVPADSWDDPEPPPLVMPGGDVFSEEAAATPAKPAPRRWLRLAGGLAAGCLIFGIGLFTGTRFEDSGTPTPADTETLSLVSLGPAPSGATGKVKLASSTEDPVTLDVSGLKPTGDNEFYELWLLGKNDELVALGSFRVEDDGDSEVKVPLPVNPSDYKYFDVSIQEENGDPNHSGRSVLRGLSTPSSVQ